MLPGFEGVTTLGKLRGKSSVATKGIMVCLYDSFIPIEKKKTGKNYVLLLKLLLLFWFCFLNANEIF